jgi:hypothetical protein
MKRSKTIESFKTKKRKVSEMKKITPIIKLFFPFVLFSFLFLILDPMKCSAKDQGFFINKNKNKQLTIDSTPITVFSTKDKIIYPGSQGGSKFVIKNNTQESIHYELVLTTSSSENIILPLKYVLSSNGNDWTVTADAPAKAGQSLSIEQVILPSKSEEYTLLWQWENNDERDQEIQALTLDKSLYENLHFKLIVEENDAPISSTSSDSSDTTTSSSDFSSTKNDGTSETTETTSNNQNDSSHDSSQGSAVNPSSSDKTTKVLPHMGELISDAFYPIIILLMATAAYLWYRKRQDS